MFLLAVKLHGACVLALFEHFLVGFHHCHLHLGILVAGAGHLLFFHEFAFNSLKVFELQLGVNDFLVAYRVNGAVYVGDIVVVEAAQHVDDGVCFTNVSQELVAQSLALAGAFYQSGDVYNLACGGHNAARMHDFGKLGEPLVGHGNHAHVRLNSTKGEIGSLCLGT